MRLWNAKCTPSDENITKNLGFHFLTVSNDEGSLGTEIIQTLSHKLDWHIFDEEIISYIAENNQISEKLVRKLDQKSENNIQMIIERFLKTIVTNSFGGDEYQRGLLLTFAYLAHQGSAILVDRGANFALSNEIKGLKVRFTASPEVRVKRLAKHLHVTAEEARQQMLAHDEEKRRFVHHYFWHDLNDTRFYDAVFNTDHTSVEQVVSSILALMIPSVETMIA
jgi:hypothetical protein